MVAVKIGVLSTFYHNYNYGGKLQAYAMIQALKALGCEAEQVQYEQHSRARARSIESTVSKVAKNAAYRHAICQRMLYSFQPSIQQKLNIRRTAIDQFDSDVSHSQTVYSDSTLPSCLDEYDAFLVGSDQVWNPSLFKKGYFLDFVAPDKYKFSYAASLSSEIPGAMGAFYQAQLNRFDGISVREKSAVSALGKLNIETPVEYVVDPTLLFGSDFWAEQAKRGKAPQSPYIFCYFLGYSAKPRKFAKRLAEKREVMTVCMPHMLGTSRQLYFFDMTASRQANYNIGVYDFLALIQKAEFVLTDSYHAAIMATQFKKQFIVFDRSGFPEMNVRADDLLSMFGLQSRRCSLGASITELHKVAEEQIDYSIEFPQYKTLKKASWEYLERQITGASLRMGKDGDA